MNAVIYPENSEILFLEADVNYTVFHLQGGKKMISTATLKRHDAALSKNGFLRVHKSFLLNPDYILNYHQLGRKATVQLQNGTILQVSRRKITEIKNLIRNKI